MSVFSLGADRDVDKESLFVVTQMPRLCGIFTVDLSGLDYETLYPLRNDIPIISLGYSENVPDTDSVLIDLGQSIEYATKYLIRSGHKRIAFFAFPEIENADQQKRAGYQRALETSSIDYDKDLFCCSPNDAENVLLDLLSGEEPITAVICANEFTTLHILRCLENNAITCPGTLSIISSSNSDWVSHTSPQLSNINAPIEELCCQAAHIAIERILNPEAPSVRLNLQSTLCLRESTKVITRGRFGEIAIPPDKIDLTDEEISRLSSSSYTAALALNDLDSQFTAAYLRGIRDTFDQYGITIDMILDAHYDGSAQNRLLNGLLYQKPDILIGQPTDETITADTFRKIADSGVKLVFLNNVPQGFKQNEFVTCITGNDRENGYSIGRLLSGCFPSGKTAYVATLELGTNTFSPKQRDAAVVQVISEEAPNITIIDRRQFVQSSQVYEITREMLKNHPEIQGMYISWDTPACEVMRLLKDIGRTDIAIVTAEMNLEIAKSLASGGMVKGISVQRTYDQGIAAAKAAANALLGKKVHSLIEIQPYIVTRNNVSKAWKETMRTKEPQSLLDAFHTN